MNTALFYDTETTGIPNWGIPSEDQSQPHIVQLAALLVDLDTRKTISTIDLIIKPEGWIISPETIEIHGITQEQALDVGVSEQDAVSLLIKMSAGKLRVAHNQTFDARIIRIATKRYWQEVVSEAWKNGASACTAQLSRSICALPKTKIPTMQEAYKHFFGKEFEGAHTALADAQACRDVYFSVQDYNAKLAA